MDRINHRIDSKTIQSAIGQQATAEYLSVLLAFPTTDHRQPTTLNTMFIVLTYDISDDRRRTQLFKTLKRFGFAVQESVFEFHLNHGELRILKRAIRAIIDPNLDQVRLYNLCPTCHHRTEMTYPSHKTANPFVLIA